MQKGRSLITKSQLISGLRALGVAPGQTVMLHASVRSLGWVVGGPDVILQALLDVLGPQGTLMMYVSWEEWEGALVSLDTLPTEQQQWYCAECPPFNPQTSRANRDWSILTEYLRTWPGAHRSNHPTASFAAVGAKGEWITAGHPLEYGYGWGSPFDKLCRLDGKVLLMGSPFNHISIFHFAEHICRITEKRVVRNKVPVLREEQRVWIEFEEFDTGGGIRELDSEVYFVTIAREYLSMNRGRVGQIGAAQSYLFDALDLVDFAVQWMENKWGRE